MKNVFKYTAILPLMAFVFTTCKDNTEMDPEVPVPEFNKDEIHKFRQSTMDGWSYGNLPGSMGRDLAFL